MYFHRNKKIVLSFEHSGDSGSVSIFLKYWQILENLGILIKFWDKRGMLSTQEFCTNFIPFIEYKNCELSLILKSSQCFRFLNALKNLLADPCYWLPRTLSEAVFWASKVCQWARLMLPPGVTHKINTPRRAKNDCIRRRAEMCMDPFYGCLMIGKQT